VEGDRLTLLFFLQCLESGWTGVIKESEFIDKTAHPNQHIVYVHLMTINPSHSTAPFPFRVTLRWTKSCGQMALHFRVPADVIPSQLPLISSGLAIASLPGDVLSFTPTNGPPVGTNVSRDDYVGAYHARNGVNHPWIALGHYLLRLSQRPLVEGAILNALPAPLVGFITGRQRREAALKDFHKTLRDRCSGWLKIYIAKQQEGEPDYLMHYIDRPGVGPVPLFGLTHVFPWVIYMLTKCFPSCAMTDATFEIMGPYVLEILQVIVRNESIPIAAAVFPTETGESYYHLYQDVIAILKEHGVSPNALRKLPLVSDHGSGLGLFIKLINDLTQDENKVVDLNDPSVQAIIILWYLCHRHLIENEGSGSLPGDWVRQLLECCKPVDAVECAQRVRLEIDKVTQRPEDKKRFDDPKNHRVLKSILGAIQTELSGDFPGLDLRIDWAAPDHPISMGQWARWMREGCPTTSNALESIHRWLNGLLEELKNNGFLMRYLRVAAYLEGRFTKRDYQARVADRSTVRFQHRLGRMERPLSRRDQHMVDFNRALNGPPGHPMQDSDDPHWTFPHYDPPDSRTFRVDYCETKEKPPRSWLPDREKLVDAQRGNQFGLVDLDMPASSDLIPDDAHAGGLAGMAPVRPVNFAHNEAGWRIIGCVRRLVSDAHWAGHLGWKVVVPIVFDIGTRYLAMNPVPLQVEVDWKFQVFDELKLNVGV
jgi:hypothetical protein